MVMEINANLIIGIYIGATTVMSMLWLREHYIKAEEEYNRKKKKYNKDSKES